MKKVIVVGGGLAGLAATMKLAEEGIEVHLISVTKVKRSHSVCAQGGINAAMNTRGEGDSPFVHAFETIKGADFLVDQAPVVEMCLTAPKIIHLLDRLGCPFNRTPEGDLDFRGFGGTLYHRTAFCGASTGQQLLYALDEQVRRQEVQGRVFKYENHEFLRLVRDEEGRARGIVLLDLFNLKLEVLKGNAVIMATGGPGLLFGRSTNSTFSTGAANARLYMQGMEYANGEFIQIHPTTIPGEDKRRLISESVRGEGGRVWVYGDSSKTITTPDGRTIPCGKTGEPWYFLEELYPAYGNLVPRDIGARELLRIAQLGLGIDGQDVVYLDVTHLPAATHKKLDSVLDIYHKFTGRDPRKEPMKIFPGVHYSMGGAWVDYPAADAPDREGRFRQMTNIPGLFNIGESDFQYHGANRLGANSLVSCIFAGLVVGVELPRYLNTLKQEVSALPESLFDKELKIEEAFRDDLFDRDGKENIFQLYEELGDRMLHYVTVQRDNTDLAATLDAIKELRERYAHIRLDEHGRIANYSFIAAHRFQSMLELAQVITKGALQRDESRGAHYKAAFPDRDDENWLKYTIATYDPVAKEPVITYDKKPDMPYLKPLGRDYTKVKKHAPEFENLPKEIPLPI
ncbi:MAG: succinate dehydrogenase flavoprotein subunit [Parachlamydiales bacterium]